jgi:DNA-binding MarR family transcriptional regulator/GNAT superfamily N-acetyltransferase
MTDEQIWHVRSFNRAVTQTIGALQDDYLGRHRPLGESRLLFEIGRDGATASELRARLDLDSGYLSRLLRSLERQGLASTEPSPEDRRVRIAALTPAGLAELNGLNRDSDNLARSILGPLNEKQQTSLVEAMAEVERFLTASAVRIEEVSPTSQDARFCLSRYFEELAERFERGFDPSQSLAPTLDGFEPPQGTFLVMRLHGEPVGCGGFMPTPEAAYIKRMWVARNARGLGLGRRLLHELESKARIIGYRLVRLETQKSLTEAQQLYRNAGYREVEPFNDEPYAHHWFEKSLL